jgi:hypothetical protein
MARVNLARLIQSAYRAKGPRLWAHQSNLFQKPLARFLTHGSQTPWGVSGQLEHTRVGLGSQLLLAGLAVGAVFALVRTIRRGCTDGEAAATAPVVPMAPASSKCSPKGVAVDRRNGP